MKGDTCANRIERQSDRTLTLPSAAHPYAPLTDLCPWFVGIYAFPSTGESNRFFDEAGRFFFFSRVPAKCLVRER